MAEPDDISTGTRHDDHDDQGIGISRDSADQRAELARFVASVQWPAAREDLLEAADRDNATDQVMELLGKLPHGPDRYENVQAVWRALGGETEDHHTA